MSTLGMFSTLEGYHEYTRGCSVHLRDTMSTPGNFDTNEKKPLPNFQVTSHRVFLSFQVEVEDS